MLRHFPTVSMINSFSNSTIIKWWVGGCTLMKLMLNSASTGLNGSSAELGKILPFQYLSSFFPWLIFLSQPVVRLIRQIVYKLKTLKQIDSNFQWDIGKSYPCRFKHWQTQNSNQSEPINKCSVSRTYIHLSIRSAKKS